jgi:hypothetical protein
LAVITIANGVIKLIGVRGVLPENIRGEPGWRVWLLSLSCIARTCAICEEPCKLFVVPYETIEILPEA